MASQRPEYYVVDESANFIDVNAKTQKDVLYFERDTGKYKLGDGQRYCDVLYSTPSMNVSVDEEIHNYIASLVAMEFGRLQFEPPIEKKTGFNLDIGRTSNTIPPGDHSHDASDIKGIVFPKGVNFPSTPKGEILYDDNTFRPIAMDSSPSSGSKLPISSEWAKSHENSGTHVTPDMRLALHRPVEVRGSGIQIEGQTISLKFGDAPDDVCKSQHTHPYAPESHTHDDPISGGRLPAISRKERGAVPPTGSPTGRSLHDDGSWKYACSESIITIDDFWVVPKRAFITFISVASKTESTIHVESNGRTIGNVRADTPRYLNIFEATIPANVEVKQGDVITTNKQGDERIQLGVILMR